MKAKSTRRKPARKVHADFPLTAGARYWCKKVAGRMFYFGKVATDPEGKAALAEWLEAKDTILLTGRKPRPSDTDRPTVATVVNQFLNGKRLARDAGEITARTMGEYIATGERVTAAFGGGRVVDDLGADDFERLRASIAKKWGPVRLANEVQRVRSIFGHGFESGLLEKPVRFGPNFKKPSKRVMRTQRASRPARMYEATEIRTLLDAAGPQMKAMILLGANCGFGNHDVANLPMTAIDLQAGWLDFPRPKTGIARRCWLWPETIDALQVAIEKRPTPKTPEAEPLLFVTKYGAAWGNGWKNNPVSAEFGKLLKAAGLQKAGRGFYALRHVAETIGSDAKDPVALDHVMGHIRDDMASTYRERISDQRLQAVAETIRGWLFPPVEEEAGEDQDAEPATVKFTAAG